jgi:O-antigen/teichoic acid export membrane protein
LNAGKELAATLQWFIPGLVAMIFFSHFEAVQQSNLDFKGVFAGYFIRQILFFILILGHTVLKVPFTLVQLAIYQSLCIAAGSIVLFIYTRKYLLFQFKASMVWTRKIVNYGGYIFGSGIMANIFASVDQLMTAKFISSTSVSYYNAASRINSFIDIPSYAAAEILFPKVSESSAVEGSARVKYLYERMVAILLSFTIPASLFVFLFPSLIISIVAGKSYLEAAPILQLYVATGIFRPFLNQSANILNSIGKPALCFMANAVSLAINLVVNYLCLRSFGFYGAAIGTLITHIIGTIGWYFIMKKQVKFELPNIFTYMIDVYRQVFTIASRALKLKAL